MRSFIGWSRPMSGSRFGGFSLVEMLVVISIIALLFSMLLPVMAKSRSHALVTVCASNLRQLGVRLNSYTYDFRNYPTNEIPASYDNANRGYYYRYLTRGACGIMYLNQLDPPSHDLTDASALWDRPGPNNAMYRCPERLPDGGTLSGDVTYSSVWTWNARSHSYYYEFDDAHTPNSRRSWYSYQGPLRQFPDTGWVNGGGYDTDACGPPELYGGNAWDLWGGGYPRGNNSLSINDPFNCQSPVNSPTQFDIKAPRKVIAYCPSMELSCGPGGSPWWRQWTSPHLGQDWSHDTITTESQHDARNYLFTDGVVSFVRKGE